AVSTNVAGSGRPTTTISCRSSSTTVRCASRGAAPALSVGLCATAAGSALGADAIDDGLGPRAQPMRTVVRTGAEIVVARRRVLMAAAALSQSRVAREVTASVLPLFSPSGSFGRRGRETLQRLFAFAIRDQQQDVKPIADDPRVLHRDHGRSECD